MIISQLFSLFTLGGYELDINRHQINLSRSLLESYETLVWSGHRAFYKHERFRQAIPDKTSIRSYFFRIFIYHYHPLADFCSCMKAMLTGLRHTPVNLPWYC